MELRTPEELLAIGFSRSRVVIMNEAHSGLTRCVRTREIGLRLLPVAHEAGVRHLRTEAQMEGPYMAQADLQRLVRAAQELGWDVASYEVDSVMSTNEREETQARNLLALLPADVPILVWCGNSHLRKVIGTIPDGDWLPMAHVFWKLSGIEPFSIDQAVTVEFDPGVTGAWHRLGLKEARRLEALGGTAGFLVEDSPLPRAGVDAVLLSTENALE